jgi:hypothetical protein
VCVCVCVYFLLFIKNYSRFGEGHEKESSIFLCLSGDFIVCAQYCLPLWVGSMLVGLQELGVGD